MWRYSLQLFSLKSSKIKFTFFTEQLCNWCTSQEAEVRIPNRTTQLIWHSKSNEAFLRCVEISSFYLFSPCGVRKFHIEIFNSSS
jgi:hypothetical protein